ncbi:MAG: hypothetical protein A2X47_13280 [Lentisphaerae bacterium GWF2_38_69]|nr:MAG: hypothetical protein A2X47_13280 [Lentisphaerae bacterium GWF2_38_69]
MKFSGVVLTDGNASSGYNRFFSVEEGLSAICFDKVFARDWTYPDTFEYYRRKRIKCAEVLVPDKIGFEYIKSAFAATKLAEYKLRGLSWPLPIEINPDIFFM